MHDFESKARQKTPLAGPLFIVLAGAASRLPLVRQLLDQTFDAPHVIGDPLREPNSKPKSKVAFGLARYLSYLTKNRWRVEKLSRAGHYTHGPIVWSGGGGDFVEWVPTCLRLTDPEFRRSKESP